MIEQRENKIGQRQREMVEHVFPTFLSLSTFHVYIRARKNMLAYSSQEAFPRMREGVSE